MKLPEIKTKKKIRDAKICSMIINGHTLQDIADNVELSLRQVQRIVYKNATVIKKAFELTKDMEKVNRLHFLKNQIRRSKKFDTDLEYSPMTLLEDLKEELEGSTPDTLIDNSKHITNITVNKFDIEERVKILKGNRCSALI